MNASIDKAVAPLTLGGVAGVFTLLLSGPIDLPTLITAVVAGLAGLIASGFTYFIRYNNTVPYKALAAASPLLIAFLRYLQTGELNQPEIVLGVQGLLGFLWTYVAPYAPLDTAISADVGRRNRSRSP